jgi:hypothetical protein
MADGAPARKDASGAAFPPFPPEVAAADKLAPPPAVAAPRQPVSSQGMDEQHNPKTGEV